MTKFPFLNETIPDEPSVGLARHAAAPREGRKLFTQPLVEGAKIAPGSLANPPATPPSAAELNRENRALFGLPEPAPAVRAPQTLAELNERHKTVYRLR